MNHKTHCQCCDSLDVESFYPLNQIPIHSNLLVDSLNESLDIALGNLELAFCSVCGFIQNNAFDQSLMDYSHAYEDTQMFSRKFSEYLHELSDYLVRRYELKNKTVLEIGCGQGDFLKLVCAAGAGTGIGYDPAWRAGNESKNPNITFHDTFYSLDTCGDEPDLIVCRHTLEHIPNVRKFLEIIRTCINDKTDTVLCFEVPDVGRVLKEEAFWDIYYEHCSYFTAGSLARLFRDTGFEILNLRKTYSDQYLVIEAKPGASGAGVRFDIEHDLDSITASVSSFKENIRVKLNGWRKEIEQLKTAGQKAALWGAGSKAMSFLTVLQVEEEIGYVVDINPNKQGFYQIGTHQQIVAPEYLKEYRPDLVIIMNPIYQGEIQKELNAMGLSPKVMALT